MYITIGFAWKPETHVDTKHVELLISKAEDIYKNDFDNDDQVVVDETEKYSTYNLEQWNADGGSFCVCASLEPGVYQFVFRVDNGIDKELKISDYYERTFLGNGRAVNYIELTGDSKDDHSFVTCSSQGYSSPSGAFSTSSKEIRDARESNLNTNSDTGYKQSSKCKPCTLL